MKNFLAPVSLLLTVLMLSAFNDLEKISAYNVDTEQSKVVWTGRKVGGAHNGTIRIKEGNLEFEGKRFTGGKFVIDMNTIVNEDLSGEYKAKLEGHLKSDDFFGVATYPTATLLITEVQPNGKDQYDISGNMTIKGITHPISFPATVSAQGQQITANAKIVVDRSKYNVRYGSDSFFDNLGDKVIYDDFDLEVSLVAGDAVGR